MKISAPLPHWLSIPGWLADVEAHVLQAAVRSTGDDVIVEIGSWCGRSFAAMAVARSNDGRTLVSYDPYPPDSQAAIAGLDAMGISPHEAQAYFATVAAMIPNARQYQLDSIGGAAHFADAYPGRRVSLLYIDGDHSGERVRAELEAWEPHLADECEVCIHDFYYEPYGLEEAVDLWMLDHPEWVMVESRLSMARLRRRWKVAPRKRHTLRHDLMGDGLAIYGRRNAHPLVSVLYNTWRLGGIDSLKVSLDRQTMAPDLFEVVLVDALFHYRCDVVQALFKDARYTVKHVNVTDNPFPRDAGNRSRNDAIRSADGEVCVWWCDFSLADSQSLKRHYATVTSHASRASSCGHIVYGRIEEEALHPDFRAAIPFRTIDDYADFVDALPTDSPLWTTLFCDDPRALGRKRNAANCPLISVHQGGHDQPFELREKIVVSSIFSGCSEIARDIRRDLLNGPSAIEQMYYAKNEATARAVLLEVNGWEESFDDGHTCDDLDICRRLGQAKSVMIVDNGNECFVPNVRPFFPLMRWKRSPSENRRLFETLALIDRPRAIQGVVNELDQIPQVEPEALAAECGITAEAST